MLSRTNHCRIEVTPTEHGEMVTVVVDEGHVIIDGMCAARSVTLQVVDHKMPMVGRAYVLDGRVVEVNDWRFDEGGALWVEDTATRAWHRWQG